MDPNYKNAYNILMRYWDFIPKGEQESVKEEIDAILYPLGRPDSATIVRALRRLG